MLNAPIWFERYQRRYRWAVDAYERFVQDLAPELVHSLQRNERVTIAVYGATQVGKTTLILDLLGLNTLSTEEVGSVLRGGQPLGKSATAIPIRYGRSPDDNWYVAGDGPLSADLAREKLGEFRRKVESGITCDANLMDIQIPQRLFQNTGNSTAHGLNIIDIPGINSHSIAEQAYVSTLADRYVAVADLILLVGRADSLGFLNERDLLLPALADWAAQPTRFRIVLTYGFSPKSLVVQFCDKEPSIETVRDVHIGQMRTHDYDFPEDFRENLFVLELGDSVVELERENPDYCQRIQPISKAFRDALLLSIENAAGPYARLQGAFQLDRVIKVRAQRLRDEREAQEVAFKEQCQETLANLVALRPKLRGANSDDIRKAISALGEEEAELRKEVRELQGVIDNLYGFDFASIFSVELSGVPEKKVSWLKEQLERCEMEQRKASSCVADRLVANGKLPSEFLDYIPPVAYHRASLMEVDEYLDSYKVDTYFLSSSFEEDRAKLKAALHQNAKKNGQRAKLAVGQALAEQERLLKADEQRLSLLIVFLRHHFDSLQQLERQHLDVCADFEGKLQEMQGAMGVSSRFSSKLNAAFLEEFRRTKQGIYSDAIPAQRFYSLLHTRLLLTEIDRMYEGKSF